MWAHSANGLGVRHRLEDHLRGSAALAREFADPFGLDDLAWWTALVHDAGKAWCEWQARLLEVEGSNGRVGKDHKSFGVELAHRHGLEPVEWVIAGHHGGLTCRSKVEALRGEDEDAERALRAGPWADAETRLRSLVPEIFSEVPSLPAVFRVGTDPMIREFAVRFLYSCVVDADAMDTHAHRLGLSVPVRGVALDAPRLLQRFLDRRKRFLSERAPSPMDRLREGVFESAMAAALAGPGLYRMTAPTGAAKTIAAAGFALRHAAEFGKRRVIVAVPYITITEQNAAVYRRLLCDDDDAGPPIVLEHHSDLDLDLLPAGAARWQRLAAENWDAPFVVTTTVQFFESLFGRMPSRMRKVHRIANSVVVLDEVQALPHALLPQVADALRILCERFGVTVLLSSATQPELGALSPLRGLPAREVVVDAPTVFASSRRVRYGWRVEPRPTLAEVVTEAVTHRQVLVVCNTVRDARVAFEHARLVAPADAMVLHLSTGMCPAHRRRVLREVKARLDSGGPLCLVSTSLIEAGVDVDFPVAFRAIGPPDSMAQVAGRCNREGRLGAEGGLVVIFDPVDGGTPPSYRTLIDKARVYFGPDTARPDDLQALEEYFVALYRTLDVEGPKSVHQAIAKHRRRLDFSSVADGPRRADGRGRDRRQAFRLIVDDTVPLVVPYGNADERSLVQECLATLQGRDTPDPDAWRRLQPFVTTIRRHTAVRPDIAALTAPVVGDFREWRGEYDDGFGLVLQDRGEDYIW